jgi:GDSL-like Lipase/Acylhydrolase family
MLPAKDQASEAASAWWVQKAPVSGSFRHSARGLRRWLIWGALAVCLSAAGAEAVARYYGLHRPLLYEKTGYGYRVQPDQHLRRFGNTVSYNSFGLRSEAVDPDPKPDVLRVLCIGDSITNGGTLTDQPQTYPYLLQDLIRSRAAAAEVLNASAGGWALQNEEGWLRANGIFGSRFVVLEVGTHDLFQPMAPASLVDGHPAFPSRAPYFGLWEVLTRYVPRWIFPSSSAKDPGTSELHGRDPQFARQSVARVIAMALLVTAKGGIPIVLHVEQPPSLELNDEVTGGAKRLLASELAVHGIELISSAQTMNGHGGALLFRDDFHPNPDGNRVLAHLVADAITARIEP